MERVLQVDIVTKPFCFIHGITCGSNTDTCAVRNQNKWMLYNEAKVTEIQTSHYNTMLEVEVCNIQFEQHW